jgi:hypothetical protein
VFKRGHASAAINLPTSFDVTVKIFIPRMPITSNERAMGLLSELLQNRARYHKRSFLNYRISGSQPSASRIRTLTISEFSLQVGVLSFRR